MKHTPGPWEIERGSSYCFIRSPEGLVADVFAPVDSSHGTGIANAQLISASPNLLKAAIRSRGTIVSLINRLRDDYGLTELDANAYVSACGLDEAIDKAVGEK